MRKVIFLLIAFSWLGTYSQTGIPGACNYQGNNQSKLIGGNESILAMTPFYSAQDCGLNYVQASKMITTRYTPGPGPGFPTNLSIAGLPPCFQVVKAYVWIIASASGTPYLTITNPIGSTSSTLNPAATFPGLSKCW